LPYLEGVLSWTGLNINKPSLVDDIRLGRDASSDGLLHSTAHGTAQHSRASAAQHMMAPPDAWP
jgi:hypothetical protein